DNNNINNNNNKNINNNNNNNNHNGDDKNLHMMNKLKYLEREHFINESNPKYYNSNINKSNHYHYNDKNNNKNNINQYENHNDNINMYNKKYNDHLPYEEDEKYTSNITNLVENDSDYIIKNIGKKYILNEDSDQLNKLLDLRKNNKKKKMRIQNNQKYSYQDHFYYDDEVSDKYMSKTLNE
ncbi:hypothetical protein PGSY75_0023200, partial [Plasmodium gaboni]